MSISPKNHFPFFQIFQCLPNEMCVSGSEWSLIQGLVCVTLVGQLSGNNIRNNIIANLR